MTRSPRAPARRRLVEGLAEAKRNLSALQSWWNTTANIYEPHPTDPVAMGTWRARDADEYPEAKADYWYATISQIDRLTTELGALREHALNEYHASTNALS